jgi:acyl carrier protein
MNSLDLRIQEIARGVFDDDGLILHDSDVPGAVPGWDSLGHISFIYSIEQEFEVEFTEDEVAGFGDVGGLKAIIEEKLGARLSS